MSQSSVRAQAFTDTAALIAGTAYWGGSVLGATSTVIKVRRGSASGAIVDTFAPANGAVEHHALAAPVGVPEGIFIDIDAAATDAAFWFE